MDRKDTLERLATMNEIDRTKLELLPWPVLEAVENAEMVRRSAALAD
jgi:hypothetical protein